MSSPYQRLTAALGFALSLSAVDLALGLMLRGRPPSPLHLLGWACLSAPLFFSILLAAGTVGRWLHRFAPTQAAAVAGLFALVAFTQILYARGGELDLPAALVAAALALLFAAPAVVALGRLSSARLTALLDDAALLAPWPLALSVVYLYVERFSIQGVLTPPSLAVSFSFAVAATALLVLLWRARPAVRRGAVFLLAALLATSLPVMLSWAGPARPQPEPPGADGADGVRQVVLITVDTLRADAVDCSSQTGGGFARLCADGYRASLAVSPAPWTLPALASIHTGLAQSTLGLGQATDRLPKSVPTLAERLSAAGFHTAAIGDNPFLVSGNLGRGFTETTFFPRLGDATSLLALLATDHGWEAHLPSFLQRSASAAQLTDLGLAWLRRQRHQRFFLWLHYFDPHRPYAPPRELVPGRPDAELGYGLDVFVAARSGRFRPSDDERQWIRALYDGEVRVVDREVGRLLAGLEELGLYRDTLVVFAGDHGEELWEHGGYEHGHTLYDEVVRVPLLLKPPDGPHGLAGTLAGTAELAGPVALRRIAGTVIDLAGLDPWLGMAPSLREVWEGGVPDAEVETSGCLYYGDRAAVVFAGHKYVVHLESGEEWLFDLASDPGEMHSLVGEVPELWQEGRRRFAADRQAADRLRTHYGVETASAEDATSPEMQRRLRALGYLR